MGQSSDSHICLECITDPRKGSSEPTFSATERGILAQLEAGFDGLRLPDRKIVSDPWILDVLGREGATPLVVGSNGLSQAAPVLLRFLEQGTDRVVVSAHFAGPTDASVLRARGPVRDLFLHPRFIVVCSRQGLFDTKLIEAWTRALIEVVGWTRMQWGSEAPIPYWRDEVLAKTPEWIKRFNPTAAELEQFYRGNADRLVFARPARPVAPLRMPLDPFAYEVKIPAPMFPYGLSADTRIPGRLVHAWLQAGGEARQPLSVFVSQLLDGALQARNL